MSIREQLVDAIAEWESEGIIGIIIDPQLAQELEREINGTTEAAFSNETFAIPDDPDGTAFLGYPIRRSPRPGATLILDSDSVRDRSVLVISG